MPDIPAVQLVKGNDGKVYRISSDQEVTRDSLVETVHKAEQLLAKSNENLALYDSLMNPLPEPEQTPAEQAQEIAHEASELAQDLSETPAQAPATPEVQVPPAEQPTPTPVAPVAEAPAPTVAPPVPQPLEVQ